MELDSVLLEKFIVASDEIRIVTLARIFEEVHKKLLWKVYNARCNEFLNIMHASESTCRYSYWTKCIM